MKYFTLALAALMTASVATAAPKIGKAQSNPHKIATAQKAPAQGLSLSHKALDLTKVRPSTSATPMSRLPLLEAEGDEQMYSARLLGYVQSWGELYFEPGQDMKNVVWGEDGEVYIKNFINIGVDYYIKGTYADDKISISFPQEIFHAYYEEEDYEQILYLNVLEFDAESDYMYKNVPEDMRTVTIEVAEDGSMSWDLNPGYTYDQFLDDRVLPHYIVGMTELLEAGVSDWYGYGDCSQEYTIFTLKPITPPADATYDQWVFKYNNDNDSEMVQYVDIAFDGDDIYLGGFDNDVVDGWIKGTVADGKAYFETAQYMGYSDLYSMNFYMITGTFEEVYYEEYDWLDFHVEFTDGISFIYDEEAKTLTAEDPASCMVMNAYVDELLYLYIYIDPSFNWQDQSLCNANPLNPEVLYYHPWDPDYFGGQGEIIWNIPFVNVNGAILDTSRMYYNFYVDGEIYGLDPEEYPYVEEYMEDIPYDYTDDFDIGAMGEFHEIYFYFDGAESFGLQSFYVGDDDVIYASDLVTYVPQTSKAGDTMYVQVVDTKYTDLMGREVANPANGIYIKSMKLADGSMRTVKVIVK